MIIGVNTSHDVSFCVLDDEGHTLWLLEEERFNRHKHTDWFSLHALERLVDDGQLDPTQVTDLAYGFEADANVISRLEQQCVDNVRRDFGDAEADGVARLRPSPSALLSPVLGLGRTRTFEDTDAALRAMFPNARISSWNHHLTHAASAWYPSPITAAAAILVVDGAGRLETATIWRADATGLALLQQTELPHSLGVFYWLVAHVLCLEEGKVMGLAAYGRPRFEQALWDRVIAIEPKGGFRFLAPLLSWGALDSEPACAALVEAVSIPRRRSLDEPLTQIHADFAASAQVVMEEILLHLAGRARVLTECRALCVAGGVMQNSLALGRILRSGLFDEYWTQPVPHDAGSAWGAALLVAADRHLPRIRSVIDTAFKGRSCADAADAVLRTRTAAFSPSSAVHDAAASLARGEVIGWFRGRAEVGPRALGARSILAHPGFRYNYFRVNLVKGREPWRPVAPVFRRQDLDRFVVNGWPSPHMNFCFELYPDAATSIPAAVHVDGTARIQTVDPGDPGGLFEVLAALEAAGVTPCLLNTSLNGAAEPLVQTPLEAIRLLALGGLDRLYLDGIVVEGTSADSRRSGALTHRALTANRFVQRYVDLLPGGSAVLLDAGLDNTVAERACLLIRSLEWCDLKVLRLGIGDAADSREVVSRLVALSRDLESHPCAVLTLQPAIDLATLPEDLATVLADYSWIVVAQDLYPCATTYSKLRERVQRNLEELARRSGGRRVIAWMDEPSWGRFIREAIGFAASWIRDDCVPLDIERCACFVILSPVVVKRYAAALASLRPWDDYIVWMSTEGGSDSHEPAA